ncbi:uncharacterized protein G2W53_025406 [Senna tora]|uniref:Uncharacterized protein n=1 Tax=Senna tora TaxID=362788 RepID=A0A834WHV6_9FABA|nr:uncharacterized protein G2W53_025406 [Senna tora]
MRNSEDVSMVADHDGGDMTLASFLKKKGRKQKSKRCGSQEVARRGDN